MGFRESDVTVFYELVRVNRFNGERNVLAGRDPIEGRWAADEAVKRANEGNRDPNFSYEARPVGGAEKKFRAAAFGDPTERLQAFREDLDGPKQK